MGHGHRHHGAGQGMPPTGPGTINATGEMLTDSLIALPTTADAVPALLMDHTVISADTDITLGGFYTDTYTGPSQVEVEVVGHNDNFGTIEVHTISEAAAHDYAAPPLQFIFADAGQYAHGASTLVNHGTILGGANTTIEMQSADASGTLVNDGLLSGQFVDLSGVNVTGYGTIAFAGPYAETYIGPPRGGGIVLDGAVGRGQVVNFAASADTSFGGGDSHGELLVTGDFHGLIENFAASAPDPNLLPDRIAVFGGTADALSYTGDGCGGVLSVLSGSDVVARLRFAGSYTNDDFKIQRYAGDYNTYIELKS